MGPEVGCYVKAVYSFAAQQPGELSLRVGDVVKVTDAIDANWIQGETIYGASGSFPSSYVEGIVLPDVRMGQRVFAAVADFPAEQSGDLELTTGDIILGTEEVDADWWKGKVGPLRGIFPLSCVHELDVVSAEGPRSRSASLRNRSASLKSRADSLAATTEMMFARALVDVVPQIEGELGFQIGDLITVTEVVDADWFYGQCHNKVGLVSTICVEFFDDLIDEAEAEVGGGGCGGDGGSGHHSDVQDSGGGAADAGLVQRREAVKNTSSAEVNHHGVVETTHGRWSSSSANEPAPLSHNSAYTQPHQQQRSMAYTSETTHGRSSSSSSATTQQHQERSMAYTSENTRSHDAEITPYAKTLYPFQAQLPTELTFQDGEIVTLVQHVDRDWIEGELDGKVGVFPATFVEVIVDCPYAYDNDDNLSSSPSAHHNATSSPAYHQHHHHAESAANCSVAEVTEAQPSVPAAESCGVEEVVLHRSKQSETESAYRSTSEKISAEEVAERSEREKSTSSGAERSEREKSTSPGAERSERDKSTSSGAERSEREKSTSSGAERSERDKSTSSGAERLEQSDSASSGAAVWALVLHSFDGQVVGDLTVTEGDTVQVLRLLDEDWLQACDDNGVTGLVPTNHVQVIGDAPPRSHSPPRVSAAGGGGGDSVSHPACDDRRSSGQQESASSSGVKSRSRETTPNETDVSSRVQSVTNGRHPNSSVFSPPPPPLPAVSPGGGGEKKNGVVSHGPDGNTHQQHHHGPVLTKPTPPLNKPKLAPKPLLKPKPSLTAKPSVPAHAPPASQEPAVAQPASPAVKRAVGAGEGKDSRGSSAGKEKVFTGIDVGLSLDNLVQQELGKAKHAGDDNSGKSSAAEDVERHSRSGSFTSGASDEGRCAAVVVVGGLDPSDRRSGSADLRSAWGESPRGTAGLSRAHKNPFNDADTPWATSDNPAVAGSQIMPGDRPSQGAMSNSGVNGTRAAWHSDLEPFYTGGDSRLSVVDKTNQAQPPSSLSSSPSSSPSSLRSRANKRHSMPPPARPVPPPPPPAARLQNHRHSFVNPCFEHEAEGQLINVREGGVMSASHPPPPPTAPCPRLPPQTRSSSVDQDLLGDSVVERRVKRPPPRPSGPRVASVPSKTPLQPLRADSVGNAAPSSSSKPVPHRPAPVAPSAAGINRPVSLAVFSSLNPEPPPPPSPSPSPGAVVSRVPPRPVGVGVGGGGAGTVPPKRPPPRLQKLPQDLMRFSPEPVANDGEGVTELVADLKRRLQECRTDIQKYEHSQRDLSAQLAVLGGEEGEGEGEREDERSETLDSLLFVRQTLQGLKEDEARLRGNLFSLSPREEKLEKAKLLEEQRLTDRRLRQEEDDKTAVEERARRREKRKHVLQEMLDTEKDYLYDLHLCLTTFQATSAVKPPSCVDVSYLLGNMEELADVSQRLLTSLESATSGKAFSDQIIGSTFVALAESMKNTYAPYCRHHDDVIAVLSKYDGIPEACQYFAAKIEEMRRKINIFDIGTILIKPVQRILKYPLLLQELVKSTEEDHPDRAYIVNAIRAMTDVAKAINEYKRRKDLVLKYKRDSDQTFYMKIAKLNFHSIKKKSSRIKERFSRNLGIGMQVRDENFDQEESRFHSSLKAVKILLRNVMSYMDALQRVITCQENLAADISDYYGEKTCEEVSRYLTVHRSLLSHHKTLTDTVDDLVRVPLNQLVALLNGPSNVMEKRNDKLLDYNNLLGGDKDEKVVKAAQNDYEAMNAQLLDELPRLYQLVMTALLQCMAAYVSAQRHFMDQVLKENCILLELPSLLSGEETVMENFNIRHTAVLDQVSMLSFIPRGFNPKMDTFRLERRASGRQSFDPTKPLPVVHSSSQSDSQRAYLRQVYGGDSLYQVSHTTPAQDLMDMAVSGGTLVGVIKDKDPMGGRQRWFVDDGANKGFVQSSILMKAAGPPSPAGSQSSLTDDMDDIASVCSAGPEEAENLPWLTPQSQTQSQTQNSGEALPWLSDSQGSCSSPYPDLTDVSSPAVYNPPDASAGRQIYIAEYPFAARSGNEVTLQAGQELIVLNQHDLDGNSEWWLVDIDGDTGYAPANYLRRK